MLLIHVANRPLLLPDLQPSSKREIALRTSNLFSPLIAIHFGEVHSYPSA
ncbi:MAG: hypothetical protein ACREVX_00650 [Clostridium sp.]